MGNRLRLAVGLSGAALVLLALGLWIDPVDMGGLLGLAPENALGLATLRADLGAVFATAGGLALAALWRRSPGLLLAPLVLLGLMLAGRVLAMALGPFDLLCLPPMAVEAAMLLVFTAAWWRWPKP